MADNIIGIDVDNYGTKPGGATLDRLTEQSPARCQTRGSPPAASTGCLASATTGCQNPPS